MKKLILVLLILLVAVECFGEYPTGLEKDDYKKLYMVVEYLPEDAKKIGLNRSVVIIKVVLRLKMAGITPVTDSNPFLYINVNVVGGAFNITLEFTRKTTYSSNNIILTKYATITWKESILGTHEGSSGYILENLGELLDQFLNEYLKTNMPK